MSREAPAAAAAPSPARFRADVLRQYDSVASAAMDSVLFQLGAGIEDGESDGDMVAQEQEMMDALVARVSPAFFAELIDRALHACVEHLRVDDNPLTEGVARRMGHLVRALDMGGDDEVWYYTGYSLMGYAVTALEHMSGQGAIVVDADETWVDGMSRDMERFVDRVSRLLLDGALRRGMDAPERNMQRLTWHALYSALELELLKQSTGVTIADMDAHEAEWRAEDGEEPEDAAAAADRRRREAADRRAHRPRAIPFLDSDRLADLEAAILSPVVLAQLELAWDAPFARMDAANTRNALHAQNVLGLAGRDGRNAPLHADAAMSVARFLAPAAIPASELARQQAAYVASVDRNRAQTDLRRARVDVEGARQRHRDAEQRSALRQREHLLHSPRMYVSEQYAMDQIERDRAFARRQQQRTDEEEEEEEKEEDGEGAAAAAAATAASDW